MRMCKAKLIVDESGEKSIVPEEPGAWMIDKFTGDYIGDMTDEEFHIYNSLQTKEEHSEWLKGVIGGV